MLAGVAHFSNRTPLARSLLDQILNDWRLWGLGSRPSTSDTLQRVLQGGRTNQSYLFGSGTESTSELMVLRIHSTDSERLGIDRNREQAIWQAAANCGLAPQIHYSDPESKYCIYRYVEGRQWQLSDLKNPNQLNRLRQCIHSCQSIPLNQILPEQDRFDYAAQLSHLWQQTLIDDDKNPEAMKKWLNDKPVITAFLGSNWHPVICHHDLVPENIIETDEGLVLIDWEYAGLGHPDFDMTYINSLLGGLSYRKPDKQADEQSAKDSKGLEQLIYWLVHLWELLQPGNSSSPSRKYSTNSEPSSRSDSQRISQRPSPP